MSSFYGKIDWLKKGSLFHLIVVLAVGGIGGFLFNIIDFPLAWMLGPLTATFILRGFSNRSFIWPRSFHQSGQLLLGYSMGLSFTLESVKQIGAHLPSMLLSTLALVAFGLILAMALTKCLGLNLPTSVLSTTPGGLSQMVILSDEISGAEASVVTFMQTIRMLSVVFIVPSIALYGTSKYGVRQIEQSDVATVGGMSLVSLIVTIGIVIGFAILAVRFRIPTPWILGPLIASALGTIIGFRIPSVPDPVMMIAQIFIGIYIGLSFKIQQLGNLLKMVLIAVGSGVLIVGFSLVIAYVLSRIHSISFVTAFLSIAPGGLPEMGVTATIVKADVSTVAAYQLFRLFFVLFVVPIMLKKVFSRKEKGVGV